MATEALIIHVVVSKFCDSLPLYRQSQMLARQGITLDRSTLGNWVGRACWWLTPLYDLVVNTVLSCTKAFADDTTLPVLDPGRGRTKLGRLWCHAVDDRPWCGPNPPAAAYVYTADRKNEGPAGHLSGFRGVLQVDGFDGFKRLAEERMDGNVCLAFWWAHMRRAFYEFYTSTKSPLALEVLTRVRALYAIEAEIRGHSAEYRKQERQARSRPIVEALLTWLQDHVGRVSTISDLSDAIRYAIRHWPGSPTCSSVSSPEKPRPTNRISCSHGTGCQARRSRSHPRLHSRPVGDTESVSQCQPCHPGAAYGPPADRASDRCHCRRHARGDRQWPSGGPGGLTHRSQVSRGAESRRAGASPHPNLADVYRQNVATLVETLARDDAAEARELVRSLVERITLYPDDNGQRVGFRGGLAAILALSSGARNRMAVGNASSLALQVKLVAGAGFEPAAFRL
jgi:hypothetical protein